MQDTILLLHGLWMRPLYLRLLQHRLQRAGFQVVAPAYDTVLQTPAANAAAIYAQFKYLSTGRLHIVAHSLGGLVALHLCELNSQFLSGRLVTLGSPVQGSCIARQMAATPLLHRFFGHSLERGLSGQDLPKPQIREWGAVVGTSRLGLGWPLLVGKGDHDGAVLVSETEHSLQTARLYLNESHTQMLFSKQTVGYISQFLLTGSFAL